MDKKSKLNYRSYVGPEEFYDLIGASQFNLVTNFGLREYHLLLDIGCGSLRGGRFFMTYLLPEGYYGIEPEQWLINEGIENNLGKDIVRLKKPAFNNNSDFNLSVFKKQFDFILAQSVFTHATSKQIEKCLNEVKKVLKPSGVFLATYGQSDKNFDGEKVIYPEATKYTLEHIGDLIYKSKLSFKTLDWLHPGGKRNWLSIYHLENEKNLSKYPSVPLTPELLSKKD